LLVELSGWATAAKLNLSAPVKIDSFGFNQRVADWAFCSREKFLVPTPKTGWMPACDLAFRAQWAANRNLSTCAQGSKQCTFRLFGGSKEKRTAKLLALIEREG